MQKRAAKLLVTSLLFITALASFADIASGLTNPQKIPQPPPHNPSTNAERSYPSDDDSPLTTFEEEMRAKNLIKLAEKEHQQNLDRARDLSQVANDLQQGLKGKSILEREDLKRVEHLEKLTKKIR